MQSITLLELWVKLTIFLLIVLSITYAIPWTYAFRYQSFKKMLCYSLLFFICVVQVLFMIVFTWNYMGVC